MSDVTRWQRVEAIFHALVDDAPGPAREARLAALCDGDADLAFEISTLLTADAGTAEPAHTPAADPLVGLRLGSYEITRFIARGGMGAVYEARRADAQFEQRVAIKIMDVRLSAPDLVALFRAERQILAGLEHQALTRLLDGGVTALGAPYLVMEYVDGQSIDRYCDAQQLDLPGRLRLFAQVCDGVAYAHRNLVLHRDLKPSNVLVTADGHAKVVDFGTATLLQPDRLATVSAAPLTPAYASPEQLTGRAVGTASDQYSLGLMLYELLTGVAPYAGSSLMAAMERAMTRTTTAAPQAVVTEAAAAARRTTLARLKRTLTGDLGTIVSKALAHEPAARYASVQHLADDLARWSLGEPIEGRAPSVAYRAARFVQRHRVAVGVAATLLVALIVATAISVQQARVARAESGKARQMNRFLTQMLSSANPSWYNANAGQAGSITVRQVLDGAGALIPTELKDSPEVEAEMRRTLGRTYIGLGAADAALPHLQRAFTLYQSQGDAFGVAFTRLLLGEHKLHTGDFKGAEALLHETVAYIRSRGADADPELHMIATNDLAVALLSQGAGRAEALGLLRESIAVADRHGINPAGTAVVLGNVGAMLLQAGRLDEAEAALLDTVRRIQHLPAPPAEHAMFYTYLSTLARVRGRHAEAEQQAAVAMEAARSLPDNHPYGALISHSWGRALVNNGQPERGRVALLEAYDAYSRIRPARHPDFVGPLLGLGKAYRLLGNLPASEKALREARAILQPHPDFKDRIAAVAGELGLTLRALGQTAEGDALLKDSYDTFRAAFGDAYPLTAEALARLHDAGAPGEAPAAPPVSASRTPSSRRPS